METCHGLEGSCLDMWSLSQTRVPEGLFPRSRSASDSVLGETARKKGLKANTLIHSLILTGKDVNGALHPLMEPTRQGSTMPRVLSRAWGDQDTQSLTLWRRGRILDHQVGYYLD